MNSSSPNVPARGAYSRVAFTATTSSIGPCALAWCFLEDNLHPETYAAVTDEERDALILVEAHRMLADSEGSARAI